MPPERVRRLSRPTTGSSHFAIDHAKAETEARFD